MAVVEFGVGNSNSIPTKGATCGAASSVSPGCSCRPARLQGYKAAKTAAKKGQT
jgi:hypothetical protein